MKRRERGVSIPLRYADNLTNTESGMSGEAGFQFLLGTLITLDVDQVFFQVLGFQFLLGTLITSGLAKNMFSIFSVSIPLRYADNNFRVGQPVSVTEFQFLLGTLITIEVVGGTKPFGTGFNSS